MPRTYTVANPAVKAPVERAIGMDRVLVIDTPSVEELVKVVNHAVDSAMTLASLRMMGRNAVIELRYSWGDAPKLAEFVNNGFKAPDPEPVEESDEDA
jgi:hypothetical protein